MKDSLGKYLSRWRVREVLPHVRGKLLDIGCGLNRLVRTYPGEGIGVDVFDWGDVDLLVPDTSNLPFSDEEFDTVTIIAALTHIPNRKDVLREVRRLLKSDGVFVMTMIPPVRSLIWHTLRRPWDADQAERGMKPGEIFGMTPRETHAMLSEAGFSIVHEHTFMLGINTLTVARMSQ